MDQTNSKFWVTVDSNDTSSELTDANLRTVLESFGDLDSLHTSGDVCLYFILFILYSLTLPLRYFKSSTLMSETLMLPTPPWMVNSSLA